MSEAVPALGSLSDRVQLKRREFSGESEGGFSAVFVPVATVWARVRTLAGRSGVSADGRAVSISHVVVLRFRNDLKPGDRLICRDQALEVIGVADLNGRRAYLSCQCSAISVTG